MSEVYRGRLRETLKTKTVNTYCEVSLIGPFDRHGVLAQSSYLRRSRGLSNM